MPRTYRERPYPCQRCGRVITPSRATYLFSISHNRNVGPFHSVCASLFTEEEEDELWRNASTRLSAAETYGPTHARERV